MSSELKLIILNSVATGLTLYFQRARVLTLPFALVVILVALFWSARVSAERQDERGD